MRVANWLFTTFGIFAATFCEAAGAPPSPHVVQPAETNQLQYFWKAEPVAGTAQLVTLFCTGCGPQPNTAAADSIEDIPLVAVLRDTLGDSDPANDRVTAVWLLGYANPGFGKKLLSAVPFFYWSPGDGSKAASSANPRPLLDLTAPQHPMMSEFERNLLQWTVFDPMTMPVRATTREYRANGLDDERLHLETAATYLRNAPVSDGGPGLTKGELDTVIARLELRKKMLGGLVSERRAAKVGEEAAFEEERIRSRNFELLRQLAEKTGLTFDSLDLAGTDGDYAMLWFPVGQPAPVTGTDLKPIWKILNIRDPWTDEKFKPGSSFRYVRASYSESDHHAQTLVPLAAYSLTYPKLPLLLVDFRDQIHLRRHEMTQRSINEITAGVIGISHFTNWYYYVAADLYDFVTGRHGAAVDEAARLDAYSRLRVALALDRQMDPALRKSMQARLDDVSVNPLGTATSRELHNAEIRYARLEEESGPGGHLSLLLDQQRRAEIAQFGESNTRLGIDTVVHTATFGVYHDRAPKSPDTIANLDVYRRFEYQLNFLDRLAQAGTAPEVAYDPARIDSSIKELSALMPQITVPRIREHALATLQKLRTISNSDDLRADCSNAIAGITSERRLPNGGIVAEAAVAAESGK